LADKTNRRNSAKENRAIDGSGFNELMLDFLTQDFYNNFWVSNKVAAFNDRPERNE